MKLVPSISRQLSMAEDKIESLTKSNRELQQEVLYLRTRLARQSAAKASTKSMVGHSGEREGTTPSYARTTKASCWVEGQKLPQPVAKPSTSSNAHPSIASEDTTPSYARTTKASRLHVVYSSPRQSTTRTSSLSRASHSYTSEKSAPSYARPTKSSHLRSSSSSLSTSSSTSLDTDWSPITTPSSTRLRVGEKDCFYENGTLREMKYKYARNTFSRDQYEKAQREIGIWTRTLGPLAPRRSSSPWYAPLKAHNAECTKEINRVDSLTPAKTPDITSKIVEWNDQVLQEGIATRTRLADRAWTNGLFCNVYINHDSLYDILSKGQLLAKECIWTWVRTHRPQQHDVFNYLSDVDFGRDRFARFIYLPDEFFKFRHSQAWEIKSKLKDLINFRNFVCHFNGSEDVSLMDEYLKFIHEITVLFYDEPRASRARALRDRLRAETERTLQEIESYTILTTLPEGGDPWLLHHSATLWEAVNSYQKDYDLCQKHPILVTAAREWDAHYRGEEYGTSIPEFEGV